MCYESETLNWVSSRANKYDAAIAVSAVSWQN